MKREIDPLSEVSQMLDSANSKIRRVYTMYTVIHCKYIDARVANAFCMWHWVIHKHLDLTFIWGHYHVHWVEDWSKSRLLYSLLLYRTDEIQQGWNSCPWLQFLAFSLDSIMLLSCKAFYILLVVSLALLLCHTIV